MQNCSCNIYSEVLVAVTCQKSIFLGACHNFRILGRLKSHKFTINCVTTIPRAIYFVTLLRRKIELCIEKKNVLSARVELLQVSEVAGDFEIAITLTFNRYSTYL